MRQEPRERVEVLAHRVRWLDRYRRPVAIAVALVAVAVLAYRLSAQLEERWLGVVSTLIATLCATLTWWLVEVGLAWLTAVWETEYEQLTRERGLPRAALVTRSKPR